MAQFVLQIIFGLSLITFGTTMASAQQNKDPVPSAKIIQKIPEIKEIEQKSEKIAPPETKPAYGGGYYAGKAWEYFKIGNYEQAIDLFVFALSFPEAEQEAKLGLAFCYTKQNKTKKAISLFEELVKKKYKLQDVLPNLIALLFEKGNYKKVNFYLKGLKGKEKRKWKKLIRESEIRKKFSTAQKSGDMHALEQLINVYQKELKNCIMPELFYDTAQMFAIRGKRKEAKNLYENMLNFCSKRWDFRPAMFYGLKDILPAPEMLSLIQKELKRPSLPGKYRKEIVTLEGHVYNKIIDAMEPVSPQIKELAESILAVQPKAHFALASLAWWQYHNKDYQTSYDMFSKLLRQFPEEKVKNLQGLLPSLIRLGKPDQAVKIMETAEIEDNEVKLTILKRMLSAADPSASLVKELAKKILVISPGDYTALKSLAWWDYHRGNYQTAYKMFFNLYKKYPGEKGELSGLIYCMVKLGKFDEALNLYEQEKIEDAGLKRDILGAKLALLDPSTQEVRILAEEILKDFPDDFSTQSSLAWWHYNHGEFKTAYEKFLKLYQKNPLKRGPVSGLINVLVQLEDYDQFEKIVEQVEIKDDNMNMLVGQSYARIASSVNKKKEFEKAEVYLKKALSFTPRNSSIKKQLAWIFSKQEKLDEALEIVLSLYQRRKSAELAEMILLFYKKLGRDEEARLFVNSLKKKRSRVYQKIVEDYNVQLIWPLYHQGKVDEALELALSTYEKENDPKLAKTILLFYEKLGRSEDILQFTDSLKKKEDDAFKKTVADYYFTRKWTITAAQTYSQSDTPYFNTDKPWFELNPYHKEKTGTSGKSRLTEDAFPFRFHYPLSEGRSLSFQLKPTFLDSDQAPSDPEMGSFYKNIPQQNELITKLTAVIPQITYEKEGEISYTFQSGSTLLGGPVTPLPTFFIGAKGRKWKLNIHQAQKNNSILAYAGLKDPYGSETWGRVLKTGVEGSLNFSPFPSLWGSVKVGYDYYWGQNVWSNQAVETSAIIGKSIPFKYIDISLGYSLTGRLFEHNTGFYTFGHGGYWSPDIYYSHGPFIGFETKKYRSYWFRASFKPGFSYSESKSVPKYPLNPERTEINGGSKGSNIGFSYRVEGYKLLTPHWALGGFYSSNSNMTGFSETNLGLTLKYYMSPRYVFLPR